MSSSPTELMLHAPNKRRRWPKQAQFPSCANRSWQAAYVLQDETVPAEEPFPEPSRALAGHDIHEFGNRNHRAPGKVGRRCQSDYTAQPANGSSIGL
jgi:hypothetical protein